MTKPRIAILGFGKLGVTLSQLAVKAGYEVRVAGSGPVEKIRLSVDVLSPGAIATELSDAISRSEIVILAMPLGKFKTIDADIMRGKLIIDAMNYWWEVDGERDAIFHSESSSEAVQHYFTSARVVKAFSHMGYHDLHDFNRPDGSRDRKAIALAGDESSDVEIVKTIIDDFGFDPLHIGPLADGYKLEPGQKAFGANLNLQMLHDLLES